MLERILVFICRNFHHRITRPIRKHYVCLECGRRYPVRWDESAVMVRAEVVKVETAERARASACLSPL